MPVQLLENLESSRANRFGTHLLHRFIIHTLIKLLRDSLPTRQLRGH